MQPVHQQAVIDQQDLFQHLSSRNAAQAMLSLQKLGNPSSVAFPRILI